MSAVALGDCLDSFGNIVADMPVPPPVLCSSFAHTLRFYIMSHCVKWAPVGRKAPLVSSTAVAPLRVYAANIMQSGLRWSGLVRRRRSPVCSSPTRRHLPPSCCAVALCLASGFAMGVCSAASPYLLCQPPPLCPARSFASLQGEPALLPVRFPSPQGGGATPSGGTRRASLACGQCSSPNSHPPALRAVVSRWREMPSLFGVLCQVLSGRHGANFR